MTVRRPVHASLWALFGIVCLYESWVGHSDPLARFILIFGVLALLNSAASLLNWRIWSISSRILGILLALYGLDVLILGHSEDVGGTATWLLLIVPSLALGIWSVLLPWWEREI